MPDIDLNSPQGAKGFADILKKSIVKNKKMILITTARALMIDTPVDTGRLRMGWNITVDAPDLKVPPPAPKGHKGKAKGGTEFYPAPDIMTIAGNLNITISNTGFISNNVPYCVFVNNGTSKQSPRRFVERAFSKVRAALTKQKTS